MSTTTEPARDPVCGMTVNPELKLLVWLLVSVFCVFM